MKAKSKQLAESRRHSVRRKRRSGRPTPRLPHDMRRQQILAKAVELFSEYGLTAQTRALADACGISQRLLYRFFPTKAALVAEVYDAEIAGPFKAAWFVHLADRSKSVEQRLNEFYREYYEGVLRRRWLRLFLYASLAEENIAPTYIAAIITRMLELIVDETAHELGLRITSDLPMRHELGWVLHGAVSHLAIRRHVYRNDSPVPVQDVIAVQVAAFIAGLPAAAKLRQKAASRARVATAQS